MCFVKSKKSTQFYFLWSYKKCVDLRVTHIPRNFPQSLLSLMKKNVCAFTYAVNKTVQYFVNLNAYPHMTNEQRGGNVRKNIQDLLR